MLHASNSNPISYSNTVAATTGTHIVPKITIPLNHTSKNSTIITITIHILHLLYLLAYENTLMSPNRVVTPRKDPIPTAKNSAVTGELTRDQNRAPARSPPKAPAPVAILGMKGQILMEVDPTTNLQYHNNKCSSFDTHYTHNRSFTSVSHTGMTKSTLV
jgi:hypothetical protein